MVLHRSSGSKASFKRYRVGATLVMWVQIPAAANVLGKEMSLSHAIWQPANLIKIADWEHRYQDILD